jgi:endonuclease/exonuclease/phosphatase family metal-dependent hydrolase
MNVLPAALLMALWLLLDFTGLLLSVISTYFYFGWAGMPLLVVRIFLIALFAFSSPLAYRLFLYRLPQGPVLKALLSLQLGLYMLISFNRQSDLFAWAAVAGVWVSGLALMCVYRHLASFRSWSLPFFITSLAAFLYVGVRVSNQGLALFFSPPTDANGGYMAWLILFGFLLSGLFLPLPQIENTQVENPLPRELQELHGLVFGPLIGISVGLIYNLHIWSAKTPNYQAAVYFLSLSLGTGFAWWLFSRWQNKYLFILPLAALSLGISLIFILYQTYTLPIGLFSHSLGCFGLSLFWLYFISRFQSIQSKNLNYFPIWGLQSGFIVFLVVLAIFLLNANPNGFWLIIALLFSVLMLSESKSLELTLDTQPQKRLWLFSLGCFMLPGLFALGLTDRSLDQLHKNGQRLRIMTSNIRYGWTDDYRFDPFPHLKWLKGHPVDILGLEEVNKGHTSGAYSDLFRLYQQSMPGHWRYADANYGFGNALMTHLPIVQSESRQYQAKDILRRSCLKATLKLGDRLIDVYVTHLSHLPHPNLVRQAQMKELLGWISQSQNPWIVMGDFNAFPDSPEVQALLKVSHPIFAKQEKLLTEKSYPSRKPTERIDYIFFSPAFQLQDQQILETAGSTDHRPVLSELVLR